MGKSRKWYARQTVIANNTPHLIGYGAICCYSFAIRQNPRRGVCLSKAILDYYRANFRPSGEHRSRDWGDLGCHSVSTTNEGSNTWSTRAGLSTVAVDADAVSTNRRDFLLEKLTQEMHSLLEVTDEICFFITKAQQKGSEWFGQDVNILQFNKLLNEYFRFTDFATTTRALLRPLLSRKAFSELFSALDNGSAKLNLTLQKIAINKTDIGTLDFSEDVATALFDNMLELRWQWNQFLKATITHYESLEDLTAGPRSK